MPGMQHKRILFQRGDAGASAYYRMTLPAAQLKKLGYDVTVSDHISLSEFATSIRLFNGDYIRYNLLNFDIIIFQLVWEGWLVNVMKSLVKAGKTVVLEIDDDYYNIPDTYRGFKNMHPKIESKREVTAQGVKYQRNMYYQQDSRGQIKTKVKTHYNGFGKVKEYVPRYEKINNSKDMFRQALETASIIQVTTPELGQLYGSNNKNVIVLPNCVDNDNYKDIAAEKGHDKPVIGWYGAKDRIEDLRLVCGAIPDDAKLFVGGAENEAKEIFGDIDTIGIFKPAEIPQVVARCDIGIAPLQDYKFNAGKSDLKGLEFAAGFVPVVASDVAPYRRWVKHGVNGFLAKNGSDWVKYLKFLATYKDLRLAMGIEAKKCAIARDIKNNIVNWIEAYNLTKEIKDNKCQVLEKV